MAQPPQPQAPSAGAHPRTRLFRLSKRGNDKKFTQGCAYFSVESAVLLGDNP